MIQTNYEEALESSLKYFDGDELAAPIFIGKYALKDDKERVLESNPDHMHRRIAREIARIESKYDNPMGEETVYQLLKDFKYIIPQGSPMAAIGNKYKLQSLSNCFVIPPPHDSYAGILFTDQEESQLMKRRGGVGFDISSIRPKGLSTSNAAGTTDGIGIFMERFSNTCREVAQNGRRGALLLSISCHHPEIETFLSIKRNLKKVTGANISVRWTDEFLNAVKKDSKVELRFPVNKDQESIISESVRAKDIWEKFIESAHHSAEPGCLFWDTAIQRTPSDIYAEEGFQSTSTNPCGEIVLSSYDSCRLLAVNTLSFVENKYTKDACFNFKHFKEVVVQAQRMMDDIIDLELEAVDRILAKIDSDPEPENIKEVEKQLWIKIKNAGSNGRRTGTGVTAIGDTIAACGFKYGSKESVKLTEKIYKTLALGAYRSSVTLAKERGAFPIYNAEKEKGHPFLSQLFSADKSLEKEHAKYGRRNIALTTTAPTGSVSTMTQTSSGIEPVFMLSYKRRRKINPNDKNRKADYVDDMGDKWEEHAVVHRGAQEWINITGDNNLENSPYWGSTANEISWQAAVDIQAAAQKWVCHAISKTINLPETATVQDVNDAYLYGWKSGCKGMTVYRDKSRSGVLVSEDDTGLVAGQRPSKIHNVQAPKRSKELDCEIHQATRYGTKWTVLVGLLSGKPYELFMGHSSQLVLPDKYKFGRITKEDRGDYTLHVNIGGEEELIVNNIIKIFDNKGGAWATRMISMSLRHGTPVDFIVEQLNKDGNVTDINKILARILKKYITDGEVRSSIKCPECGSASLHYLEGCVTCSSCGHSKC